MLLSYLILGLTGLVTIAPFILSVLGDTPGLDLTRATLISTALAILICFVLQKGTVYFVEKILVEEL
jgi:putative flippase GtrA